jgi:hypothetical protein
MNAIVKWPALIDPLLIVANLRTQSLLPPMKIQSEKCAQIGVILRVSELPGALFHLRHNLNMLLKYVMLDAPN